MFSRYCACSARPARLMGEEWGLKAGRPILVSLAPVHSLIMNEIVAFSSCFTFAFEALSERSLFCDESSEREFPEAFKHVCLPYTVSVAYRACRFSYRGAHL